MVRIIKTRRSLSFSERLEANARRIVVAFSEGGSVPEASPIVAELALLLDHLSRERAATTRAASELQDKSWSARRELRIVLHAQRYQPFPPSGRDPILKRLDRMDRDERAIRESALLREHTHHTKLLELLHRHSILTGVEPWMSRG